MFLILQGIVDPNMGNPLQQGAVGMVQEDLLPTGTDHYCYLPCLTRYFCSYGNQNFAMEEMLVGFVPCDHASSLQCLLFVCLM